MTARLIKYFKPICPYTRVVVGNHPYIYPLKMRVGSDAHIGP